MTEAETHPGDPIAALTMAVVAVLAIIGSWTLPWWVMESRAPQYGQRVLRVEVGPRGVGGDVKEVDGLGHYVGIPPMGTLAAAERRLAPVGMTLATVSFLALSLVRRRWLRLALVAPMVLMPIVFVADLSYWLDFAVQHRDPDAALSLTVTTIDTQLFGAYSVGQFKVVGKVGDGLRMVGVAALLGIGLALSRPVTFSGPWRRRLRQGSTAAAALLALVLPGRAEAAELRVAAGDTITQTIARAADGDVVIVPGRVFHERLSVDRRITLRGEPGAVIDGGGEGSIVSVTASGAALEQLTLRGTGDNYTREDTAIRIENAKGVRLSEVRIEDCLFGIFALMADDCVIEKSTIVGKDLPHPRRGDGVRLVYSHRCTLTENLVERSRDVVIWYSQDTRVERNVVRTSRYGLHYMYSDRNSFRRNRFEDNQVGAAIMYSKKIDLSENAFSFSSGPAAYGMLIKDADDVFILGNRFVGNDGALFLDGAPQSRGGRVDVRGNLFARNDVAVTLQPSSQGVRFWENSFVGNRAQVQVQGTGAAGKNDWAVEGRGNFWSDGVVYDRDGDGVSELPYRADATYEVLAARYPSLALFAQTPAAEALDTAAKLFPIFAPRPQLEDPHPLVRPALNAWLESEASVEHGHGLAGAGGALLALAGAGAVLARRLA